MNNNKQQTAVEWFNEEINKLNVGTDARVFIAKLFQQAKEMEKQQHLKWNKFLETEKTLGISDVKTIERIQWYYNQYYNETFKTKTP